MTRARNAAKGFGTPPPLHHWMEAVLLLCVSLVHRAVSTLKMIGAFLHRDWHTKGASNDLPHATSSIHAFPPILRDDCFAIPQDEAGARSSESMCSNNHQPNQALILRDLRTAQIVSKDGGGLTALSPLVPTNVGTQGAWQALFCPAASGLHQLHNRSWIPTFVGMNGARYANPA